MEPFILPLHFLLLYRILLIFLSRFLLIYLDLASCISRTLGIGFSFLFHLFSFVSFFIAGFMFKFLNRISRLVMAEIKEACTPLSEGGVDASKVITDKVEKRPHPSTTNEDGSFFAFFKNSFSKYFYYCGVTLYIYLGLCLSSNLRL